MSKINETTNMNMGITLKDSNGQDVQVAYVSTSLDPNTQNFNLNLSVSNIELYSTAGATNLAGDTVAVQYENFETAVKAKAKEMGYMIF